MLRRNLNSGNESSSREYTQVINLSKMSLTDTHLNDYLKQHIHSNPKTLVLCHNQLEGELCTWSAFSQLTTLSTLDLSHNNIKLCYLTYLPSTLQSLDISSNRISQIHIQHQLKSLTQLNLSNNLLLRLQITNQNTSIKSLNISNNKLSILGLGQLTQLQQLQASNNQIVVINLPPLLTRVSLHHNSIKSVQFLSKLTKIRHLDISYNQIKDLEFHGEQKPELKYVDASHNRIRALDGFDTIPNLQVLYLSNNQLSLKITHQILKLKFLKEFQCLENQFIQPSEIQGAERMLKKQLPLKTLKIFDKSGSLQSIRVDTPERQRNSNRHTPLERSRQRLPPSRSEVKYDADEIKESPFKLFIDSERHHPIEYTLGSSNPNTFQQTKQIDRKSFRDTHRSADKPPKPTTKEQNEPEVKYFLQILNKYSMIPVKPILKVQKGMTHKHEVGDGIEQNLIKDLYRNQGLRFSKIYKVTNLLELQEINKVIKEDKTPSANQSLFFVQNNLVESSVEKYLSGKISFKEVMKGAPDTTCLSRYPAPNPRNYIIKSSYLGPSRDYFELDEDPHHFTLIYLIQ